MPQKAKERRSYERIKRALAIQFRLRNGKNGRMDTDRWHLSMTIDMSAGGIAFQSSVPFSVGDMLELHVVMSGIVDVVKATGKIVRVEELAPGQLYSIAVQFTKRF